MNSCTRWLDRLFLIIHNEIKVIVLLLLRSQSFRILRRERIVSFAIDFDSRFNGFLRLLLLRSLLSQASLFDFGFNRVKFSLLDVLFLLSLLRGSFLSARIFL